MAGFGSILRWKQLKTLWHGICSLWNARAKQPRPQVGCKLKIFKAMAKNYGSWFINHPKSAKGIYKVRELTKTVNGYEYRLIVEGGYTRSCGYERAAILCDGERVALGVYKWLNRPWQTFDGECATRSALEKLGKVGKELEDVFLLRAAADEEREAQQTLDNFQAAYNNLGEKGREILAKSGASVETMEDAKALTGLMALGALMGL